MVSSPPTLRIYHQDRYNRKWINPHFMGYLGALMETVFLYLFFNGVFVMDLVFKSTFPNIYYLTIFLLKNSIFQFFKLLNQQYTHSQKIAFFRLFFHQTQKSKTTFFFFFFFLNVFTPNSYFQNQPQLKTKHLQNSVSKSLLK